MAVFLLVGSIFGWVFGGFVVWKAMRRLYSVRRVKKTAKPDEPADANEENDI